MKINSRRGAKSHHHSSAQHFCLDRLIQTFVIATLSIIVIGYYYFLSTTISAGTNNNAELNSAVGVRGGDTTLNNNNLINNNPKATIGYAITVSGCPKNNGSRGDFGAGITDGAAILKHSIHLSSIQSPTSGSKYDYKMYALVHPEAEFCARPTLQPLGYEILIRDVPVPLNEIEGDYLREKVPANGCCGEKEFVKLHAFTILEHPVVVHLDLDTLVLKPMDKLFDVMIDGVPKDGTNEGIEVAFNDPLPSASNAVDAYFTRDYNMNHPGMKHAGVQGGFLVLRPSRTAYDEFVSIIRKGDFRSNGGWGGKLQLPFRMKLFRHNSTLNHRMHSHQRHGIRPILWINDISRNHSVFL
jgi:hypothetical protein